MADDDIVARHSVRSTSCNIVFHDDIEGHERSAVQPVALHKFICEMSETVKECVGPCNVFLKYWTVHTRKWTTFTEGLVFQMLPLCEPHTSRNFVS